VVIGTYTSPEGSLLFIIIVLKNNRKDTSLPNESNNPQQSVAAVETSATTTFITADVSSTKAVNESPALSLVNHSTTGFNQTLATFLEKPIAIATGTFVTTNTQNENIASADIPEAIFNDPMVSEKLVGYQGVRGTVVLKLVTSSNPFQQGRLFLWYYPLANMDPTYLRRAVYLQHTTQWPHVELDVACDSECSLEIPFVSPDLFYDLVGGRKHLGVAGVNVYLPLLVGSGSNTVGFTLYAYFKPGTVELINPTYKTPAAVRKLPSGMKPQSNSKVVKKKGPLQEQEQMGPTLSNMFKSLKDTASMIGEGIPMLKPVTGPVAWVSNLSSKALSAFGWSKPSCETPWMRTSTSNGLIPYIFNIDGTVMDQQMGFSATNKLQYYGNVGGNDYDEMVFDNILTRFANWTTGSFTTLTEPGILATYQLAPSYYVDASPGGGYMYNLPVGLFGKLFQYWRGKFRMRIKFAKTEYHNAKIVVAFFPGVTSVADLTSTQWVHREILDLSLGNEWSFEFPYTHQVPYISVDLACGCVTIK